MSAADRASRIGQLVMRVVSGGLVVLLVLAATLEGVGAKPSPGSYQNAFTAACRDHGGTPKRVRTRVVKCTLTDGTVITCDFNVDPPSCTKALTQPPLGGVVASPIDGNLQPIVDDGQPVGGGAGGSAGTWTADLGAAGANVVLTADQGGQARQAKLEQAALHQHGHGKRHKR